MSSEKNVASSIRQRLLNITRQENIDFQLILTRYALERFLFRLSTSKYCDDFVLKGAMLFVIWQESFHRPTRDLDLLSFGNPDEVYFKKVITDICRQALTEDGLVFVCDSIKLGQIKEDDKYQGLRATLIAKLDSARIPLQIDIGFGDSIVPEPVQIDFPSLLDLPVPKIRAYSKETVVAEKFHAMVERAIANSRMKDFYDIWVLAQSHPFEADLLRESIEATFLRRGTTLPSKAPLAFTEAFATESTKMSQWKAFLRKANLHHEEEVSLVHVTLIIRKLIAPLLVPREIEDSGIWNTKQLAWTVR